jgi:hypothetical protein
MYFGNIVPYDIFKYSYAFHSIRYTWTSCWEKEIPVGCFPINLYEYVLHIYKDQYIFFIHVVIPRHK